MKKALLALLVVALPLQTFAVDTTTSDVTTLVNQMKALLDQYSLRIQSLEAENRVLREEVAKAGIKIPLSAYSGAIAPVVATGTAISTPTSTPTVPVVSTSVNLSGALQSIANNYSTRYAEFVKKIHLDWPAIQSNYKLPATAYIGGYEFVKQGNDNHVFVDIVNDIKTATGAYDTKILYEYHTGTYQRKLIGFFEYNRTTGYYTTKSGSNPFAGVPRTFVRDPYSSSILVPNTASTSTTTSSTSTSTTPTGTVSGTATSSIPSMTEIEKAYSDKRYLSVISLSNIYLTTNPATYDLLRLRYRTYFIIGKYNESLAEIAKIEAMGKLSTVACDAKIIATYSQNSSLISKYTAACK